MIIVESGAIARITLDRPNKVNALTAEGISALAAAIRTAGADEATRLIVLRGNGPKGFCGGADIAEFVVGTEALERQGQALVDLTDALETSPAPILSVIHGRTLGGGAMIAALSDVTVASSDLMFGFPEMRFLMFPVIVEAAIAPRVGASLAHKLCLTGRLLDAQESRTLNLIDDIIEGDFEAGAEAQIATYAERADVIRWARAERPAPGTGPISRAVAAAVPIMLQNYNLPGVRESIAHHLPGKR